MKEVKILPFLNVYSEFIDYIDKVIEENKDLNISWSSGEHSITLNILDKVYITKDYTQVMAVLEGFLGGVNYKSNNR